MEYKHTEIGWFFIGIMFLSVLILTAGYLTVDNFELTIFLVLVLVMSLITLLFYKLTVQINNDGILLTYGIGIIRIHIHILHLDSTVVTRTRWYYGLGIRFSPQGMIYNIQSLKALKIRHTKNGNSKTFFIGSPEPEAIKKATETHFLNQNR